jgi:hypothetical protein
MPKNEMFMGEGLYHRDHGSGAGVPLTSGESSGEGALM